MAHPTLTASLAALVDSGTPGPLAPVLMTAAVYLVIALSWKLLSSPSWGKLFMRAHYAFLSVLSLVMFVGVVVAAFNVWRRGREETTGSGLSARAMSLICLKPGESMDPSLFFWMWVFHKSKYIEIIDTVIILHQGRPLTFLHYFHHALVIFQSWTWLEGQLVFTWIGAAFNSFVHIVMYYFYYVGASGRRVSWRARITQLQIVQFMCSFAVVVWFYWVHYSAPVQALGGCRGSEWVGFSIFFNGALLFLFIRLAGAAGARPNAGTRKAVLADSKSPGGASLKSD